MTRDPFLLRFGTPMVAQAARLLRYDTSLSVTQTMMGGVWVDRLDHANDDPQSTRVTKVRMETTDDD